MTYNLHHTLYVFLLTSFLLLYSSCDYSSIHIKAIPYQETGNDDWGLISTNGEIILPAGVFQYQPSAVVNEMFSVPDRSGFHLLYNIKDPFHPVSQQRFIQIGHFFEDVTLAREFPDSPILIIDKKGKIVGDIGIGLHYDILMAHNFSEGRSLFTTRQGKYGYMDTHGKIAISPIYDLAYDFHEGVALVGVSNEKGSMCYRFINKQGKVCINIPLSDVLIDTQFSDGLLKCTLLKTGQCCYLNKKGEIEIFLSDSICESFRFKHGVAKVQTTQGIGIIDKEGKFLIPPIYQDALITADQRILLQINNEWHLADMLGKYFPTDNRIQRMSPFYSNGLAIAYLDSTCVWINEKGALVDGKSYETIVFDSCAMQICPQRFIRNCSENPSVPITPATSPAAVLSTPHPDTPAEVTIPHSDTPTSQLSDNDWEKIKKDSPFYAEVDKILEGKLTENDADNRKVILNYVEHLRTSYETKDIDFLNQLFSEEALIIVGKVIQQAPHIEGEYLPREQVIYNIKSKQTYLSRLKTLFKQNKEIRLKFSNFTIMRHPTTPGLYGVSLRQQYNSELYSDDGYLFLLWDFRDETAPLIHIRTWQPRMLNNQTPLPEDEIFNIRNFNLQ